MYCRLYSAFYLIKKLSKKYNFKDRHVFIAVFSYIFFADGLMLQY